MYAWLEDRDNKPTPTQYYLMEIACEVRKSRVEKPGKVKLSDMQLRFDLPKRKRRESTIKKFRLANDSRVPMTKARWFAAVGYNPKDKRKSSNDNDNREG